MLMHPTERMFLKLILSGLSGLVILDVENQAQTVDNARQKQPILHRRCAQCHGEESPQASLNVLTRAAMLKGGKTGPAIVPGSSQTSLLVQHLTGEKKPMMPMGQAP